LQRRYALLGRQEYADTTGAPARCHI
jgi:hypothetical protein